jgi:hypothetical protein
VAEIRALLDGSYRSADGIALHAVPGEGAGVELWLVVTSVTYRHEDRLTSHRLLAREWGLSHVRAA